MGGLDAPRSQSKSRPALGISLSRFPLPPPLRHLPRDLRHARISDPFEELPRGLKGRLLFEDRLGLADAVPAAELKHRMNVALLAPGRRRRCPALFFLSSRGRIAAGPGPSPSDLEAGPLTGARLHRSGFAAVAAYCGLDATLASRAEVALYAALLTAHKANSLVGP